MTDSSVLLETQALGVRFGGLIALRDLDLTVRKGLITSLIGPNGAGKSTTINAITGFIQPSSGRVSFQGSDVTGRRPEDLASMGMIRNFQNAAMFRSMTIAENLASGYFVCKTTNLVQTVLRTTRFRKEEQEINARIDAVAGMLGLKSRLETRAADLPYGDQRILSLGIALMARPKLLLVDEPAAGLSPEEARELGTLIQKVNSEGMAVLLIEHNMSLVMSISDHVIVLKNGQKLTEGTPEAVRRHPDVIEAYLGSDHA